MMAEVIKRGSTPKQIFCTEIDLSGAVSLYVVYKQNDVVVIEKTIDDVKFDCGGLSFTLTQEETLRLEPYTDVYIEIGAEFPDGNVPRSEIVTAKVLRTLKSEVI